MSNQQGKKIPQQGTLLRKYCAMSPNSWEFSGKTGSNRKHYKVANFHFVTNHLLNQNEQSMEDTCV